MLNQLGKSRKAMYQAMKMQATLMGEPWLGRAGVGGDGEEDGASDELGTDGAD